MKAKRAPNPPPETALPPEERRRLIRIVGFASVVALAVGVAIVLLQQPRKLTEIERAQMRDYEGMRSALAHDDLASAQKAAEAIIRDGGATGRFHDSATVIQSTDQLAEARSAFARMSQHAQLLVKGNPGFYIVGCSMSRCPVKCSPCLMPQYADWVQVNENVENPFMGKSSPHCGVIKIKW